MQLEDKKNIDLRLHGSNQNAGTLNIEHMSVVEMPTFIDYLRSGWGISLAVAIDFTGSNGEPTQP